MTPDEAAFRMLPFLLIIANRMMRRSIDDADGEPYRPGELTVAGCYDSLSVAAWTVWPAFWTTTPEAIVNVLDGRAAKHAMEAFYAGPRY